MSRYKTIIFIIAGVAVLAFILVLFGVLPGLKPKAPPRSSITFWSTQENGEAWLAVIAKFREKYPTVTVNYNQVSEYNYLNGLINAMASGSGPDVFLLKNSWIAKQKDKIYPLPQASFNFSARDFKKTFVDAASSDLIMPDGNIIGLPLYIDTPILLYNKDMFNTAGIAEPPGNWEEVAADSQKLTRITSAGDFTASGIALGTARNLVRYFEIASSLIMQNGDDIMDGKTGKLALGKNTQNALEFFASFSDPASGNYAWNSRQPSSQDAFAEEKTAMEIVLPQDIARISAKNPHLNLGALPFPQYANSGRPTVYASYFFPAVSKFSKNQSAAWQFVFFAAGREGAAVFAQNVKSASARRDILSQPTTSDEKEIFGRQALFARSWAVPDDQARGAFYNVLETLASRAVTPAEAVNQLKNKLGVYLP